MNDLADTTVDETKWGSYIYSLSTNRGKDTTPAVPLISYTACYFEISHTTLSSLFLYHTHRGLILHRPLGPSAPKINTNDWLRIGSTFHSLHAIAAEASPVKLPGNKNPERNREQLI
eukprot:scaffold25970_cov155-Skeletonema_dohrnii-CCMP3373.AAC.7